MGSFCCFNSDKTSERKNSIVKNKKESNSSVVVTQPKSEELPNEQSLTKNKRGKSQNDEAKQKNYNNNLSVASSKSDSRQRPKKVVEVHNPPPDKDGKINDQPKNVNKLQNNQKKKKKIIKKSPKTAKTSTKGSPEQKLDQIVKERQLLAHKSDEIKTQPENFTHFDQNDSSFNTNDRKKQHDKGQIVTATEPPAQCIVDKGNDKNNKSDNQNTQNKLRESAAPPEKPIISIRKIHVEKLTPEEEHVESASNEIKEIDNYIKRIENDILRYKGSDERELYKHLYQILSENIIKLDGIDSKGYETITNQKRQALQRIQENKQILEEKCSRTSTNSGKYSEIMSINETAALSKDTIKPCEENSANDVIAIRKSTRENVNGNDTTRKTSLEIATEKNESNTTNKDTTASEDKRTILGKKEEIKSSEKKESFLGTPRLQTALENVQEYDDNNIKDLKAISSEEDETKFIEIKETSDVSLVTKTETYDSQNLEAKWEIAQENESNINNHNTLITDCNKINLTDEEDIYVEPLKLITKEYDSQNQKVSLDIVQEETSNTENQVTTSSEDNIKILVGEKGPSGVPLSVITNNLESQYLEKDLKDVQNEDQSNINNLKTTLSNNEMNVFVDEEEITSGVPLNVIT